MITQWCCVAYLFSLSSVSMFISLHHENYNDNNLCIYKDYFSVLLGNKYIFRCDLLSGFSASRLNSDHFFVFTPQNSAAQSSQHSPLLSPSEVSLATRTSASKKYKFFSLISHYFKFTVHKIMLLLLSFFLVTFATFPVCLELFIVNWENSRMAYGHAYNFRMYKEKTCREKMHVGFNKSDDKTANACFLSYTWKYTEFYTFGPPVGCDPIYSNWWHTHLFEDMYHVSITSSKILK